MSVGIQPLWCGKSRLTSQTTARPIILTLERQRILSCCPAQCGSSLMSAPSATPWIVPKAGSLWVDDERVGCRVRPCCWQGDGFTLSEARQMATMAARPSVSGIGQNLPAVSL